MTTFYKNILVKRANAATWVSQNPTLLDGEFGWERDTNKLKIGDGSTAWNSLGYFGTEQDFTDAIATKQDILVSGTNIKTINNTSILGSGNIEITGTGTNNDASALTTGLLANARIQESNVTQYQAALQISTSQLIGAISTEGIANGSVTLAKLETSLQTKINNMSGVNTGDQNSSTVTVSPAVNFNSNVQSVLEDHETRISAIVAGGSGDMLSANNLSDLTNTTTALVNLGFTSTITELNYTDGVTSPIQTQLDNKQNTLISGTNIKTINGSSVLGSGDIVISGTDDQTLTLAGTTLSISGGNSVSFSNYARLNNTNAWQAAQRLLSNTVIVGGGGNQAILSFDPDGTASSGDERNLVATSTDITYNGVSLLGGDGNQDLSLVGTTLSIENGNSVDLSGLTGTTVFSSRGNPPSNTQTIAQAYPSVTLAEVQALHPSATLNDSASWFYLQEVISSYTPRFFYSTSGNSELKIPTGDYRLSRSIVMENLSNMVIDWGFSFLLPFGSFSGNAIEVIGVENSNRDLYNINLRIRGEWQMKGIRISRSSQWYIGGQIDQTPIGVTIQDSYYGSFAPTMTIRECMTGIYMEYGETDPQNEINTINCRNVVIGGANETQVVNNFGLPSGTKRYGILSESRHTQINFNGMTIEGVDVGMLFDDTNGNITLRGTWSDFYWEDIKDNLVRFNATRSNSEVDLSISGGISNIWVSDVDFEFGVKGRIQIEDLAKNPGSNLGIILNNTPDDSPITLITDFEPSRITDNTTTTSSTIIYSGKSLLENTFPGSGSLSTDQSNTLANSVLAPKTISKNSNFTLVLNDSRMTTPGNSDLGRSYIMEVNDAGTTICTVPNIGNVDDVWRFRTATISDQFDIVPDVGVTFDWNGKTTQNAVRISGIKGGLVYMRKSAINSYFLDGDITGFSVASYSPNNLYIAASPINADNQSSSLTNLGFVAANTNLSVVDLSSDSNTVSNFGLRITRPAGNTSGFAQINIANYGTYFGLVSGQQYNIRFKYRKISGDVSSYAEWTGATLGSSTFWNANNNNPSTTWIQFDKATNASGTGPITYTGNDNFFRIYPWLNDTSGVEYVFELTDFEFLEV